MMPKKIWYLNYAIQLAAAAVISACWLQPVAAQTTDAAADAEAAARQNWRAAMEHNTESAEGCFEASYPSLVWGQVQCREGHPRVHPTFNKNANGGTVGNGNDCVAQAAGLISGTYGSFPKVTCVKSESGGGGVGGILGPNEYMLQINTNRMGTTSACAGGLAGCKVWQQFIYATDYLTKGQAYVFIQYWLIGWGPKVCPTNWHRNGGVNCYRNSAYKAAPDMNITSLPKLSLSGTAAAGHNDIVVFNNGTTAYMMCAPDSVLDISQVWQQSEVNIVGDAGSSQAVFNAGSPITV